MDREAWHAVVHGFAKSQWLTDWVAELNWTKLGLPSLSLINKSEIYGIMCCSCVEVKVKVAQSCLTLGDHMDYVVHGILQTEYWSG